MNPLFLYSPRLLFIAGTPELVQAELDSTNLLAKALNVAIPSDWPPGEYDQSAIEFFLGRLQDEGPAAIGWYSWYVVTYPTAQKPATLVGSAGYFGPPDANGLLEIGYSVSEHWRRQGIASEIVGVLVNHAWQQQTIKRIIAHTMPDNIASMGVLTKNGFCQIESDDPEKFCFELSLDL